MSDACDVKYPISPVRSTVIILIEPSPTLPSQPLCIDHTFQQHRRPVFRIRRARIERLLYRETRIETDATKVASASFRAVFAKTHKSAAKEIRNRPTHAGHGCVLTELEGTHRMGHPESERLVNVVSRRNTLRREKHMSFHLDVISTVRATFSRHMIASFMKGIKRAFETKPGTSCDVATSDASTISSRSQTTSRVSRPNLYRTPLQRHASGQACLWTFAPQI